MRTLSVIDRPLADEHVIGVDPPLAQQLPAVWRRRINPFSGRSLSDLALSAEQDVRAGVQRLRGQSVTSGIVSGLDVMLDPGALGGTPAQARLQILPGLGLARSGEDVVLSSPRSIALADLPVRARVDVLDAIDAGGPAPAAPGTPAAAVDGPGVLASLLPQLPRRLSKPTLGGLIGAPAASALPLVAVLVAQPVTATLLAQPRDTCSPDPRDDPYDDLQLIDGVRLVLDFWPAEMLSRIGGPDYALPPPGASQRNRLAWSVFGVERLQLPDETHPWEDVGVALALVAFNPDWTLAFVDRSCVARLGGRPKPRTAMVAGAGTPTLWQAQVTQLSEQLTGLTDLSPATLASTLRQLPPVGFLPIDVVDLTQHRQDFFSAGWGTTLAPLPLEQADLVVAESAALQPFNLDVIDEAELLVLVPERVYEPGLLQVAGMDPAFDRAVLRAVAERTEWLARREWVRRRRDVLQDAATGRRPGWPTSDTTADETLPDPADRAPVGCTQVRQVVAAQQVRTLTMTAAGSSLAIAKGDTVYAWVRIADATGLSALSLVAGVNTRLGPADWTRLVFWGTPVPPAGVAPPPASLSAGVLPAAGQWIMLSVSADQPWTTANAPLAGATLDGLQIVQQGGTVQWGPIGRIDAAGMDTVWIADEAPPGAILADSGNPNAPGWPTVPAGVDIAFDPPEDDFATVASGGVRTASEVLALRARWPDAVLANDFRDLDENGIIGFVQALDGRIKATNDAVDLGFLRARADIYRVRQYMLGADAASRLVTSPALADVATRDESARAQSADLATFVKSAYETDFLRDPNNPMQTGAPGTYEKPSSPPGLTPSPSPAPAPIAVTKGPIDLTTIAAVGLVSPVTRGFSLSSLNPVFSAGTLSPISSVSILQGTATVASVSTVSMASRYAGLAIAQRGVQIADVQSQLPIAGPIDRTASIAERLTPPPSVDAYSYAIAGKQAVLTALAGLLQADDSGRPPGIALGDLPALGFHSLKTPSDPPPTILQLLNDQNLPAATRLYGDNEAIPDSTGTAARHEADYFTFAVKAIDNAIGMMRQVEARISLYDGLVADARSVGVALSGHMDDADARLRTIAVQVEEARQDYSIASSLRAEEQARIDALNAKRQAVLAANASVVLYRRPRRSGRVMAVPTTAAAAASDVTPILACNREHPAVPEQIHAYVALLREAPVAWFPNVQPVVDRIDRLDAVRAALTAVQQRAAAAPAPAPAPAASTSPYLQSVNQVMLTQQAALAERRTLAMQLDLGAVAAANLANAKRVLVASASLSDLMAGDHNRAALTTASAQEIDQIGSAAACLHDSFGDAPAIDRLQWAEVLSQFEEPAPLRNLNTLAGWNDLPPDTRRTQQGLVDWLFSRIDTTVPAAVNAINELVRICLLMAAQAPVDRLIPVRLVAPAPARVGSVFHVFTDVSAVRIGMTAQVRDTSGNVLAHAVVEDLSDGVAQARVSRTFGTFSTLTATARIELSDRPLALS